jgi:DnaJ-domain-containing protein 1
MGFHNGLRQELLNQVRTDRKRYKALEEMPTETQEDILAFYEAMFKRHHSDYALNEFSRVKHMLLKTALDGVQ